MLFFLNLTDCWLGGRDEYGSSDP